MLKGIFCNSFKSQCSIYEVGLMCYEILKSYENEIYHLDYSDNGPPTLIDYDFLIVNYHYSAANWATEKFVKSCRGTVFALVLEVRFEDPLQITPRYFHHYLILDPSLKQTQNTTPMPRPLSTIPSIHIHEHRDIINTQDTSIPIIGSFGFTPFGEGKQFDVIVEQVNRDFDEALIRFNLPLASCLTHLFPKPDDMEKRHEYIYQMCMKKVTKPGIKLLLTYDHMTRQELVDWCATNTINCFFYERDGPGLSATVDQAVCAGKPLLVTEHPTFRHINPYINSYPNISIKDAIKYNHKGVLKAREDWSPCEFYKAFKSALFKCTITMQTSNSSHDYEKKCDTVLKTKRHIL